MFLNKWKYAFSGFSRNVFRVPFNFDYITHNQNERNENPHSNKTKVGNND